MFCVFFSSYVHFILSALHSFLLSLGIPEYSPLIWEASNIRTQDGEGKKSQGMGGDWEPNSAAVDF